MYELMNVDVHPIEFMKDSERPYYHLPSSPSLTQVIAEARRFKRRILAEMLENKMEELVAVMQN